MGIRKNAGPGSRPGGLDRDPRCPKRIEYEYSAFMRGSAFWAAVIGFKELMKYRERSESIAFARSSIAFKSPEQCSTPMQSVVQVYSFVVIINALFLQGVLLFIVRRGRNQYLNDITHFRPPKSFLSRYYSWRIAQLRNVLIETVLFQVILVGSIIGILLFSEILYLLTPLMPYVLFVAILSLVSSLQMSWRVKEIIERERIVISRFKDADDKVGLAQQMVEDLYQAGAYADGRAWFALFKITLRQDTIGWSVRDVLVEKSRMIADRLQTHISEATEIDRPSKGPEIE